ncbi:hypothetical protein P3W85_22575, partial [Cupriavidus basilensis]
MEEAVDSHSDCGFSAGAAEEIAHAHPEAVRGDEKSDRHASYAHPGRKLGAMPSRRRLAHDRDKIAGLMPALNFAASGRTANRVLPAEVGQFKPRSQHPPKRV